MTLNEQATQNLKDIKRILDSLLVYIKLKEGAKLFNGIIRYNIRCHCMESDYLSKDDFKNMTGNGFLRYIRKNL